MKKQIIFLLLSTLLMACDEQDIKNESEAIPSTEVALFYPAHSGNSDESVTGFLGYGYDASGLCGTVSVREKILDNLQDVTVVDYPSSTFPNLFKGNNFIKLTEDINNQSQIAIASHLKTLISFVGKTTSIDPNSAFVYYTTTSLKSHSSIKMDTEYIKYISKNFQNDIIVLSPKELISKYGTHFLTNVYTGMKFEVIYEFKSDETDNKSLAQLYFSKRMNEFAGMTPYMTNSYSFNPKNIKTNEKLIYNVIGNVEQKFNYINTTDYNPNGIKIDLESIFANKNYRPQFITIAEEGLFPIYELINDPIKKLEVKQYTEDYLSTIGI